MAKKKKSAVDAMKPGDFVYMILAFDKASFAKYVPDPCIFLTKASAEKFCRDNATDSLMYKAVPARVGMVKE